MVVKMKKLHVISGCNGAGKTTASYLFIKMKFGTL